MEGPRTMKTKNRNINDRKSDDNKSYNNESSDNLERIAEELVLHADKKLRPGGVPPQLYGAEDDIKQEAVLLALRWYLKYQRNTSRNSEPWNAPRSLAIALRFVKRRALRKIMKSPKTVHIHNASETVVDHPINLQLYQYPVDRMRTTVEIALSVTLKSGAISHANHVVARLVLIQNLSVSSAGLQLGLTRSAIYQHLKRINRAIRPIIDEIEVPYC